MAKVRLTVRVDPDLKAAYEGWAVQRERSVSWLVEQAMTRMRSELLGPSRDVSRETEPVIPGPVTDHTSPVGLEVGDTVKLPSGQVGQVDAIVVHSERPHRHRYDQKVEGTETWEKGRHFAQYRCACGEVTLQAVR